MPFSCQASLTEHAGHAEADDVPVRWIKNLQVRQKVRWLNCWRQTWVRCSFLHLHLKVAILHILLVSISDGGGSILSLVLAESMRKPKVFAVYLVAPYRASSLPLLPPIVGRCCSLFLSSLGLMSVVLYASSGAKVILGDTSIRSSCSSCLVFL